MASDKGELEICSELLNSGARINNVDREGQSPLMRAAFKGNHQVVQLLLKRGADVGLRSVAGQTALHRASAGPQNHIAEIIKLLLEAKSNPDLPRTDGDTALHICVLRHSLTAVRALIARGANPNAKNADGMTPMMLSAQNCGYLMTQWLVRLGGDYQVCLNHMLVPCFHPVTRVLGHRRQTPDDDGAPD
jgi:ankyrin repeat protein